MVNVDTFNYKIIADYYCISLNTNRVINAQLIIPN